MAGLTAEVARSILSYNKKTGSFTWKRRAKKWFASEWAWKVWNKRFAKKPALVSVDSTGHFYGSIFGERYPAHHIAWLIVHGVFPDGEIDHINGDAGDNSISNLRDVSHGENLKNQRMRSTNTSGVMGISWNQRENKWRAYIHNSGREKHIGYFKEKDAAISARKAAEIALGYHANHGQR